MRALARRSLKTLLALGLGGMLAALLAATVYWSAFDPRWVPFLAGVLFAATLALGSQASRALWLLHRRARQLERARQRLAEEVERARHATEAFRLADARLRGMAEAVPLPLLYVDRDERCRFHNHELARKLGMPSARIDGRLLRELLPEEAYLELVPHIAVALSGKPARQACSWGGPHHVALEPFPPGTPQPGGLYAVFSPLQARAAAPAAERGASAENEMRLPRKGGEALYLRAVAAQLAGWDDPAAKLAAALREDRFVLLQQKIEPLAAAPGPYYEILLRLQEEEDNLLPPGGFLPQAEACGMMVDIDRWVTGKLIERCRERKRAEPAWPMPVYWVNLSAAAVQSADFARSVQKQIQAEEFDGRHLCFELAEPDVIAHRREAQRLIDALKPAGVRFAIDAYGGVKAFEIRDLGVDFVKIDGAIVQNLLRSPAQLARARAIHGACRQLKVATVAEMVEEPVTIAALRSIGIDYAQGFGIARPEPLFGRPAPGLALVDAA